MSKISVIGVGRIGLGIALNFEDLGHTVIGYDIDEYYVKCLNKKVITSSEPEIFKMLKNSKNFTATTNISEAIESDFIFVMVRTESNASGEYNHEQVESVFNKLMEHSTKDKTVVLCSNVSPGFCNTWSKKLESKGYLLSFNPEWVAQGTIVRNLKYPDVVVIGEYNYQQGNKIQELYSGFVHCEIHRMDTTSAELTKVGLNCFLTTKISYANSLGDLAIKMGADPNKILTAIGKDSRIGSKYFSYGHSYGGPCFPRDNRALIYTAKKYGEKALLQKASDQINKDHLEFMVEEFCKNNGRGKVVHIDEVTYKPGVEYIEESRQLDFAYALAKRGYDVYIKERKSVIDKIKEKYGDRFSYDILEKRK